MSQSSAAAAAAVVSSPLKNTRTELLSKMSLERAERYIAKNLPIPQDVSLDSFKPDLHKRSPLYQSYLYPIFGIYRLCTDYTVAKPILFSTSIALVQSTIITGGYTYISFKYIHWFVQRHLLNFSYFNLRPMFSFIQYVSSQRLTSDQMEWYTAAFLTLFQAAILSNSLIGYRIRAQGKRAGEAVLSARPRRKQTSVKVREDQERSFAGNFLWRFAKDALWSTFILPIYAIPLAGQLIYAFIRAPNITGSYLSMFRSAQVAQSHRIGIIGFGIVAGILSSLPFVGHFFSISNSVGIALWIQDLENTDFDSQKAPDMASTIDN